MQWLKRRPSFFGLFMSITSLVANLGHNYVYTIRVRMGIWLKSVQRRPFDSSIMVLCVRWYITYKLSYYDLRDLMAERGVNLSHTTTLRWANAASPNSRRSGIALPSQFALPGEWTKPTYASEGDGGISISFGSSPPGSDRLASGRPTPSPNPPSGNGSAHPESIGPNCYFCSGSRLALPLTVLRSLNSLTHD
jgi:hypothetical protein